MEWWLILILIIGGLLTLFAIGVPVAFSFMAVNMVAAYFLWNGFDGLEQIMLSIYSSVTNFALLPIPLFILMGEILFRSRVAPKMMDTVDKWLGKLPGRLSSMAIMGGTLFATLSGSSMASTAMLGSVMIPEIETRGYHIKMSVGPILGSGGLAIMIPPSALGVILVSLAQFSVGKMLVAIILPGLLIH